MKKIKGIIAPTIITLLVLMALSSCEGSFLDPGTLEYISGGTGLGLGLGGDGGGGFGGGGGGGGTSAPGTPRNVSASAQSSNSIRITWSAPSSGGTVYLYNIYRSSSANGTYSWIDYTSGTSYIDTYLSASTTYYYKVSAVNNEGKEGSRSSSASATTQSGGGTTVPGTPTNVQATALSSNSIRITWNAPTSGGTVSWYNIWRSTSQNGTYVEIGFVRSPTRTYTDDTGLNPSTTYYYKVDAENYEEERGPLSSYASATTQSGGGGNNPFAGTTWIGLDWEGYNCVMTFAAGAWTLSYPDSPGWDYGGTYTYNGNTATLTIVYDSDTYFGTATISGNTLNVVIWDEEFTLTKQ